MGTYVKGKIEKPKPDNDVRVKSPEGLGVGKAPMPDSGGTTAVQGTGQGGGVGTSPAGAVNDAGLTGNQP